MSDQETEMEWFGDDEPKKPTGGVNTPPLNEDSNPSSSPKNTMGNDGFKVVHRDAGDAKGASGEIIIETAVKGLLYRCEVFKSGSLIDAREINCKDLVSNEEKDYIFKQRYMATHNTFKMQYIAEEFFREVESTEGEFKDGDEEHCKVVTSVSDDTIRTIIYVDGEEFETKDIAIKDNIKNKKSLLEKRCQIFHLENIAKYIDVEKFPVNTFLNPVLTKLPFYKKNPMHSFYVFLVLLGVLFVGAYFVYGAYLNTLKDGKLKKKKFSESIWHTLENRCMESKDSEWRKGVKPNFNQCTNYRYKDRIFTKEAYDRIFGDVNWDDKALECKAAKKKSWKDAEGKENKELKESCKTFCNQGSIDKGICSERKVQYSIVPNKLRLNLHDAQPIYLANKSNRTLVFRIESIKLDGDLSLPQIVRISGLEESRSLEPGDDDSFKFSLVHSAAESYENGAYSGVIKVGLTYDGEPQVQEIKFTFEIDL